MPLTCDSTAPPQSHTPSTIESAVEAKPNKTPNLRRLMALQDEAFVRRCYEVLLKREPEEAGLQIQLNSLRSGAIDKYGIIRAMTKSEEGRIANAKLPGLTRANIDYQISRTPIIGGLYRWSGALFRLPKLLRRISALEIKLAAQKNIAIATEQELAQTKSQLEQATLKLAAPNPELKSSLAKLNTHSAEFSKLEVKRNVTERRLNELENQLVQLNQLVTTPPVEDAEVVLSEPPSENKIDYDKFYFDFENEFRGSRALIKSRHQIYLPIVQDLINEIGDQPILDIACGRGEWLELLQENHFSACGIDINAASLEEAKKLNLDVQCQDAFEYLAKINDSTFILVTAFHLIEHLELTDMLILIDEIKRVLIPGGKIILETPNPENFVVSGHDFYLDPTHRNPLPPVMMEFVLRQRGFANTHTTGLHPPVKTNVFRGLEGAGRLNKMFFGFQDYNVMGTKP